MMRMSDLLESLSMPYVFPDENAFVLGIGSVIVGLLFFRVGLARRRRQNDHADHSDC
jgi:hypothetical protein